MELYVTQETISTKAKEWLKQIDPFNKHIMRLNKKRAGLLVIDMQDFFLNPASPTFTCGGLAILPNLKKVIYEFRKAGCPVIFTKHVHHNNRVVPK
jgi:isochorismate hydrolase